MSQPEWEFVANLGDVTWLDHGGYFVYRDKTGVYPPEAEFLDRFEDGLVEVYTIHRIVLDDCTCIDGVISDNKFHPDHPAWWFRDDYERLASSAGWSQSELTAAFCSADPLRRAEAYKTVGDYHGWDNLDSYPLTGLSRAAVKKRYDEKNRTQ